MLQDRFEADVRLAERLAACYEDPQGLILALPRGGVAVGYALSLALRLPLDRYLDAAASALRSPRAPLTNAREGNRV